MSILRPLTHAEYVELLRRVDQSPVKGREQYRLWLLRKIEELRVDPALPQDQPEEKV